MQTKIMIYVLLGIIPAFSVNAQQPSANPFQTSEVQQAPQSGFDLTHVALNLEVDYKKLAFTGTVINTLKPLRDNLSGIVLYCSANLKVEEVKVAGQEATFTREGDLLTIKPAQPLKNKKEVKVQVKYSNIAGKENRNFYWIKPAESNPQRAGFWTRGGSVGNRQWLPTWDYPNDFATSEIRVSVPADWFVIGNGVLRSNQLDAGKKNRTFHWQMTKPHATYLISLVAAPLSIKYATWRGIPLMYVVPKGSENLIDDTFGETPEMLSYFSDILGVKYPWPKYAQTAIFDYSGAQENISATSLNTSLLTEKRKGFRKFADVGSHELAHQWFGDLVSPKDWGHLWLSEGLATFFRYLYMEHSRGKNWYAYQIEDNANAYFSESRQYRRPLVTGRYPNPSRMFDNHSYQKGAAVAHTLRSFLGDKAFFKGLRNYLVKYSYRAADTDDLRRAMTEATGIDLTAFFNQWVYKPGHPVLDYTWTWDQVHKQVVLKIRQIQDTVGDVPIYELKAKAGLITNGSMVRETLMLNSNFQEFRFHATKRPDAVLLDPDHDFLREIPVLHWDHAELPVIFKYAPNAVDRQRAMEKMSETVLPDAWIKLVAERIQADTTQFPGIRSITRLGELKLPALHDLFLSQIHHPNDERRLQAIRALGQLPKNVNDMQAVRSLVNNQSTYEVVLAAVSVLADWDATANRYIFENAVNEPWPNNALRFESLLALRKADAAEGKASLDPDTTTTNRLINSLSDFAKGIKDTVTMSAGFRNRLSPDGDRGYREDLQQLKSISFIFKEDVDNQNLRVDGEPVSCIYYYKMVTGDHLHYLRFFLTANDKVADIRG